MPLRSASWIEDLLVHGAGRTDAIFLAEAWRAIAAGDAPCCWTKSAELAAAFAPSAERRLETLAQGAAFMTAVTAVWPHAALERLAACERPRSPIPWPSESARPRTACRCAATAQAFVQAFAANLVSAGVRLIPLGQTDGLRVIARLEPLIPRVVAGALAASLDDIGGVAVMADIASMRHETQYTRLFRS